MRVASPFLGPLVVQLGGGVGRAPTDAVGTQPDEIARMTAGVGLVKDLGAERGSVFGMVRGLAGDVRAPEGETGRTATAQLGAAIRL